MNSLLCKITTKKFIFLSFILIVGLQSITISAQEKFKVVLDAGHGGKDPGNSGNGYSEKTISLKIVLAVGKLLESDKSIEVIYTRDDDTFLELYERSAIAQKSKADLFVSVHCDAFGKSSVYGVSTFVLGLHENDRNFEVAKKENSVILLEDNYKENYDGFDPNSPSAVIGLTLMQEEYLDQSLWLARLMQDNFVDDLKRKDRLVKQAGFLVLRNTFMPSVYVEAGFLTNKNEGAYLNSKKGQQGMAESIYKAIKSYKQQIDANRVVEVKPKKEIKVDNTPKTRIVKGVNFKVQISSSTKKVATASYNFKGLKGIERVRVGAHHKYYYGLTNDYNKALALRTEAKTKGYKGAFVVAFKNEKKISVKDALTSK